jgi:hypothetical protein
MSDADYHQIRPIDTVENDVAAVREANEQFAMLWMAV